MSVFDVAKYILEKQGKMTAMKLQKLMYYSQCWSLVWDEEPLFKAKIEAWANGPVCPALYRVHKGKFKVTSADIEGDSSKLGENARETVDAVLKGYGGKPAQWLSDLTHLEEPWQKARKRARAKPGQNSKEAIIYADMHEYYSGVAQTGEDV